MWICNRCQERNREGDTRCIGCAAPRTARRFGANTRVEAPSIREESEQAQAPVPAPALQTASVATHAPGGRQPRVDLPPPRRVVRCASGRALVAVGAALCVLLPVVAAFLCVQHFELLSTMTAAWLLPGAVAPALLPRILCLVALAIPALLLLALPGLSALGLGRLLIRLTPPELRREE